MKAPRTIHRGTGRSSLQIRCAPADAYYVVPTETHIPYMAALAEHIGRNDLKVVSVWHPSLRSPDFPVEFDHFCKEHNGGIYYLIRLGEVSK